MKADTYGRRTWDKEEYEKAAKARQVAEKAARKLNEKKQFDLYAPKAGSSKDRDEDDDDREEEADKRSSASESDGEGGFEEWDSYGR